MLAAPDVRAARRMAALRRSVPQRRWRARRLSNNIPSAARSAATCGRQRGKRAIREGMSMIIQTAPAGEPRLAIMMYEHTALSHQFARAFGNDQFEATQPNDLMFSVVLNHDAGWAEFDRDPGTDPATGLPYNLIETPAQYITVTSRLSPEFNERQHPFCGLMSSMHSWGLYNGRYGLSNMVLIDKIPPHDRPLAQRMLDGELDRQKRLKAETENIGLDRGAAAIPELQAASVLRYAGALFQPDACKRARRSEIRACAAKRQRGCDHHGPSPRQ